MRRAFTLLELMLVVTIIGLLYAGAGVAFTTARRSGRDAQRIGDVLLISRAIDESAITNHGQYPRNANSGSNATMCADQILGSSGSNPNNIDLTMFTSHTIPKDPAPAVPAATCQNMLNGYTYHTEYGHKSAVSANLAASQEVVYSIEVGLENPKQQDETEFYGQQDLQNVTAVASTSRNRYIYNGRYCAANCYN